MTQPTVRTPRGPADGRGGGGSRPRGGEARRKQPGLLIWKGVSQEVTGLASCSAMETNARLPGGIVLLSETSADALDEKKAASGTRFLWSVCAEGTRSPPSPQPGPQGDAMAHVLHALLCR